MLRDNLSFFSLSSLGRGLDDYKGVGFGSDLRFWKKIDSEEESVAGQENNNKWELLKVINTQTLGSLFQKTQQENLEGGVENFEA